MKKTNSFIFILIILICASSCSTLRITTKVPFKPEKSGKDALIMVMVDKVELPVLPLIDAAIFNKRPRAIANLIQEEEKKMAASFRDSLSKRITESFGMTVMPLELMRARMDSNNIVHHAASLETGNAHFTHIILPEGEINPIDFPKGDFRTFIMTPKMAQKAKILCQLLQVDAVAFSHSNLQIIGVTAFGAQGNLLLKTRFYMFGVDGKMLAEGEGTSKAWLIQGGDVGQYLEQLEDFNYLNQNMLNDIVGIKFKRPK